MTDHGETALGDEKLKCYDLFSPLATRGEGLRTRLLNAALLVQSVITIATTTMVPDGAPRPPDRASAWCSPEAALRANSPGAKPPPPEFVRSLRGGACGGSSAVPWREAVPRVPSARARSPGRPRRPQPRASAMRAAVWAAFQRRPGGRRPFSAPHGPPSPHCQAVRHFRGVSASLQAVHTRSRPTRTLDWEQRPASAFPNQGRRCSWRRRRPPTDTRPSQRAGPGRPFVVEEGLAGLLLESRPSLSPGFREPCWGQKVNRTGAEAAGRRPE